MKPSGRDASRVEAEPRLDLWRKVTLLWIEHFAWDAPRLLGAEMVIERDEDDSLVEQLAQFLWRNRRV